MRASSEGLKSEALRAALASAVTGKSDKLEDLLCRYGGGSDRSPNLRLAAAFGVELGALPGPVTRLLDRFGSDDASPDTPRVFLPMAAAHGWVGLLRAGRDGQEVQKVQDVQEAWAALAALAADERAPVRVATLDALALVASDDAGALDLVTHAIDWLGIEDRESRYAAIALMIEVLGQRRVVAALADRAELLAALSGAINEIAEAPRAAERLDGRRRLVMSLPRTLATVVAALGAGDRGPRWLEGLCETAVHPDVRGILSDTILRLRTTSLGHGSAVSLRLRQALQGSAKPLRDPSRLRPGTGRGKASRRVR